MYYLLLNKLILCNYELFNIYLILFSFVFSIERSFIFNEVVRNVVNCNENCLDKEKESFKTFKSFYQREKKNKMTML